VSFDPRPRLTWTERLAPGIALIVIVLCFAAGLAAQEKDANDYTLDQITAAVCAVETGATWVDTGNVRGRWSVGGAGEISHWQITDDVLSDLGLSSAQKRKVGRDPIYAESVFRLWYARLLSRTGSHSQALAAFHRGLGGRHRRDAREYAERVLTYAGTL
jgi:hypothetical protein